MKIIRTVVNMGLVAVLAFGSFAVVFADDEVPKTQVGINVGMEATIDTDLDDADEHDSVSGNTDSDQDENDQMENKQDDDKDTNESDSENESATEVETSISESHRSTVAAFVQSLLKIADRQKGIGAQVKVIAQAQNDSNDKTSEALKHVENRSRFMIFFFGSDYKNLGFLRSEMVATNTQIDQLKALLAKTTIVADQVALNAQIQVLIAEQARIESFISAHENQFSLFGWLAKKGNN